MSKRPRSSDELFELKWNNFSSSITDEIYNLRQNDTLVDLSFCCEGVIIGCHKLIVYACSPVLRNILSKTPSQHPIIYVTDIKLHILRAVLNYIYQGEVHISKSDLVSFMKAADSFQIKGLQSKRMESAIYGSEAEYGEESLDSSRYASKKRRPEPTPVASTSRADPLKQEIDNSNLDYSEFENEFTYEEGNESVDEPESSDVIIRETVDKLRSAINFADDGPNILQEFETEQNLTEQSKEELIEIFCDYLSRTYPRVTRSKRELIAEAAMSIFPAVFGDDPKTLADQIRIKATRLMEEKNQGGQTPESRKSGSERDDSASTRFKDVGSDGDVDEFERLLKDLKRRRIQSNLKQIEHDLMIFIARSLAQLPSKQQDTTKSFIFNPFQKKISIKVDLDSDCNLTTQAICPICKEMILVESVAKRQLKGMKYRFKSLSYINHVKEHLY